MNVHFRDCESCDAEIIFNKTSKTHRNVFFLGIILVKLQANIAAQKVPEFGVVLVRNTLRLNLYY